jgi:hypothetical protein
MNHFPTRRRQLPNRALAVIALLNRGYSDLKGIAYAVGVPLTEVKILEAADDERVRRVIREGLPEGFTYRLKRAIKCRTCGNRINLIPCILCG